MHLVVLISDLVAINRTIEKLLIKVKTNKKRNSLFRTPLSDL